LAIGRLSIRDIGNTRKPAGLVALRHAMEHLAEHILRPSRAVMNYPELKPASMNTWKKRWARKSSSRSA
jgi:hypothetical protein